MWNSLRCECPPKSGQRVEDEDLLVGPEAVEVGLGRRDAARAAADDHAVIALARVEDGLADARTALRRVDLRRVGDRRAVQLEGAVDDPVGLARVRVREGRRVVAGRQLGRRQLRPGGPRLAAGHPGRREAGRGHRRAVEEVAPRNAVALLPPLALVLEPALPGVTHRRLLRSRGATLPERPGTVKIASMGRLDALDLSLKLSSAEEAERLEVAQERLTALRLRLGGQTGDGTLGPPVCVLFEGWDASGKGGAIKRLVAPLDPRHVRVVSFAAPTHDEKRHHWLWRFWPALPGWGGMAVLDRSWYGRVLVERVEKFATKPQWSRAYEEIADFERALTLEGMVLIKFWLHISGDEQLARFEARAKDPLKQWKLTDEDWRNRKRRKAYATAVEDMIEHTDTENAPWHLVEADSKRWARVSVIETVNGRIEAELRERKLALP
jgi:polyphosphate kinase 2 (PPK2 family)